MQRLEGRIALVTGGSSGIGRAAALAFAKEGAKVVVADIDVNGGEETVRTVKEAGGEAIFARTDVTRPDEVAALVEAAVDRFGRLDCAFNNAGVEAAQGLAMFTDLPDTELDRLLAVNLKGVWHCLKQEIAQMLKQGGGAIVNTASVAGLVGFQLSAAYVASKHGVVGLTKAVALDYASAGIRVNAVCPGVTRTPMVDALIGGDEALEAQIVSVHPIGRLARPEEIARVAVWLCTDEASFLTGQAIAVDGGLVAQ